MEKWYQCFWKTLYLPLLFLRSFRYLFILLNEKTESWIFCPFTLPIQKINTAVRVRIQTDTYSFTLALPNFSLLILKNNDSLRKRTVFMWLNLDKRLHKPRTTPSIYPVSSFRVWSKTNLRSKWCSFYTTQLQFSFS